jgi:hypothetical protein
MANAAHTGRFRGPLREYDTEDVRRQLKNIYEYATDSGDALAFVDDMVTAIDVVGNWLPYLESQRISVKGGREEARRLLDAIDHLIKLTSNQVMSAYLPGQMSRPVHDGPNLPNLFGLPAILAPYRALVATHTPADSAPNIKRQVAKHFVWECVGIFKRHSISPNVGATGESMARPSPLMRICTEVAPNIQLTYNSTTSWAEIIKEVLIEYPD